MSSAVCWPALLALVSPCIPRRSFSSFIASQKIDAEIIHQPGPDHTAREAADTLGCEVSEILKSLVFVIDDKDYVLVVARGTDRVDLSLLSQECGGRRSARLASPKEAEAVTGYAPGCIPPLSPHMLPSTKVMMDSKVLTRDDKPMYAGAGQNGMHLRIAPSVLRRAANAKVASLVEHAAVSMVAVQAPALTAHRMEPTPLTGQVLECIETPTRTHRVSYQEELEAVRADEAASQRVRKVSVEARGSVARTSLCMT